MQKVALEVVLLTHTILQKKTNQKDASLIASRKAVSALVSADAALMRRFARSPRRSASASRRRSRIARRSAGDASCRCASSMATACPAASIAAVGMRCAPPSGSFTTASTRPNSNASRAVSTRNNSSSSADLPLVSSVRRAITFAPTGTRSTAFSSISTTFGTPKESRLVAAPASPTTSATMGTPMPRLTWMAFAIAAAAE
mmetsp:Transcript_10908/g.24530  ORF Transcript_10908/g.24530 Transcript_10908/m.24530 type:complete len:201 (+) Transcript_10908:16-618(+)